ncbi:MAG: alpha/beta hydrolase [Aequorivita sp.]
MKRIFLLLLLVFPLIGNSQDMFEYEREVSNKSNYDFQEIEFQNSEENIKLSGTLITPKSDFDKIVIIVPGSDPSTRYAHFILTEEFLNQGIAVYRFDNRGLGKSEGKSNDSAIKLSEDLSYAYRTLEEKYKSKSIGVLGHSLGGMASLEMVQNGLNPKFLILIGTPVVKNGAYLINRLKTDYENSIGFTIKGKSKEEVIEFIEDLFTIIAKNKDSEKTQKQAKALIKERGFKNRFIRLLDDEEMIERVQANHEEVLKNIAIPTLYLVGSKDEILNYKQESNLVSYLKNPKIKVEIYDDLNHYLTEKDAPVGTSLYKMDKAPLYEILHWTIEH